MVWGCFSANGVGPLYKIEGIMDRFGYRNILDTVMLPFAEEEMPIQWCFQHDNDPKHSAKIVKEWFVDNRINVLKWPSNSPDLNPIENLWEILNRSIRGQKTYSNKEELFNALLEAWNNIPPNIIEGLIASMPRRCAAVIKNSGYCTKY